MAAEMAAAAGPSSPPSSRPSSTSPSPSSGPTKKEIAASKRASQAEAKAQLMAKFRALQEDPAVTGPQLDAFMADKPNTMWDYKKYWRATVHTWIERAQWGPFFWYLNVWHRADGFAGMPFLGDILDKMRDSQPEGLFRPSELWTQMRTFVGSRDVQWWQDHVKSSKTNDAYMTQLFKHDWPAIAHVIVGSLRGRGDRAPLATEATLYTEVAKYVYRNNYTPFMFDFTMSLNAITQVDGLDTTRANANVRALVLALIKERPESPPLVATPDSYSVATRFLTKYVGMGEQGRPVIEAFLSQFDMGRTENKLFLQNMLIVFISDIRRTFTSNNSRGQQLHVQLIELFVRHYRINVNNLYIDMDAAEQSTFGNLIAQTTMRNDPIINPSRWMNNNLPLVALAIMYGNKKALLFLVSLGATLKRCAFTLADLTTDPEIHKVLLADNKATKIQRAYQRHMYAPEHATQATRQSTWESKVGKRGSKKNNNFGDPSHHTIL